AAGPLPKEFRMLPPLRTTIHAGEDFMHLQTGLRMVDEAIRCFELREGDRIGHGVALGIDARLWASRAGQIAMSLEDRLLDLVWEWSWYGHQGGCPNSDRWAQLEYQISILSEQIFDEPVPPMQLELLREDLGTPHALRRVGFPCGLISAQNLSERDKLL